MVTATYLSTQFELPRDFGLISGIRYELTQISGNWKTESQQEFNDSYSNILSGLASLSST